MSERTTEEYAIAQTSIGSRVLTQAVNNERSRQRRAEAERRAEERATGLPRFVVPEADAPFGPTLNLVESVLSEDDSPEPPMRDVEGKLVEVQNRVPAGLHQLGTGDGEGEEKPAPPAPTLVPLEMNDVLSLVEQHVEFYKITRRGDILDVRLPHPHANRLRKLHPEKSMLPVAKGVCTLPFLLPDGTVMHGEGLDRETGLIYRLEPDVLRSMPQHTPSNDEALDALMWLRDVWLCDVETDWTGFIVGVSMMLSMIQRMVLPGERPAYVVSAAQRGAGKTTFGNMVSAGVLGKYATAARWSTDQEEMRKSMLPYISADIPLLVFDNTHRGQDIDSDALNAALTSAEYSDRVLGASSVKYVQPRTVIVVNGNNIRPSGDFASPCQKTLSRW